MDDNSKMEARRRKILDNAEARLRFIKEGIPWRTPEVDTSNVPDNEMNENLQTSLLNKSIDDKNETLNSCETEECDSRINFSQPNMTIHSEDKLVDVHCVNPKLSIDSNNFINNELNATQSESLSKKELSNKTNETFDSMKEPSVKNLIRRKQSEPGNVSKRKHGGEELNTSDPFKTIKALINESSAERKKHKQKQSDQFRFLWISCLIMASLGILVRIVYTLGFSWIFNEMMLVPFATIVTPRMILAVRDPPAPSGTVLQALIMSGVKVKIINKAFTLLVLFRTFFQLFSVYLVSFLFTHLIVETMT